MKIYVGIDPGRTGAVAKILEDSIDFTDAEGVNLKFLGEYLKLFCDVFVCIERAQAMPGQGTVSMFHYGQNYGEYLGMLKAMGIPYQEVRPQTWKKEFGLIHADKSRSIQVACQLFPQCAHELKLKKHHGRAEALLLSEFARRKNM